MNDSFHIIEILRDGISSFSSRKKKFKYLLFIPLIIVVPAVEFFNLSIDSDSTNTLISSLSIFTGFFFTLIIYVADKANNKKRDLKLSIQEEDQRLLKRYLDFTENLIIQISFSIVLSIIIIFILMFSQIDFNQFSELKEISFWLKKILDTMVFYCVVVLLIYLLLIVSNMYAVLLHEVNDD